MLLALLALAAAESARAGPRTSDYALPRDTFGLVPEQRVVTRHPFWCGFEAMRKRHEFDGEIAESVRHLSGLSRVEP